MERPFESPKDRAEREFVEALTSRGVDEITAINLVHGSYEPGVTSGEGEVVDEDKKE